MCQCANDWNKSNYLICLAKLVGFEGFYSQVVPSWDRKILEIYKSSSIFFISAVLRVSMYFVGVERILISK